MKEQNFIAWAVPFFLASIFLERWADGKDGRAFDIGDSVANLGCGVLMQVFSVVTTGLVGWAFGGLYAALARLTPWSLSGPWAWPVALVAVDFMYYWWHRLGHQVNFFWAMHVVHHQSPRYNLTVALRQGWVGVLVGWAVYVPVALLGVPFKLVLASLALNLVYQFWIHTEKIGKLGAFELVFNTPSHHRVHHGVDDLYIDKNYGGVLIVWDRLFGTFQEETIRPTYGITTGFPSLSPGWANLHYWFELAALSRRAPSWGQALKLWVMYPGWRPAGVSRLAPEAAREAPHRSTKWYSLFQLSAGIALLIFLYGARGWQASALAAASAATVLSTGWVLDKRPWARTVEWARVLALAGMGALMALGAAWTLSAALFVGFFAGAAGFAVSLKLKAA